MMEKALLIFGISTILSLVSTPLIRFLALKGKFVDTPKSPFKLHERTTTLLGGAAIFLSFALTLFFTARIFESKCPFAGIKMCDNIILMGVGIFLATLVLTISGIIED